MKKLLVMIIIIAMVCMMMPTMASAATATHGRTFDLSALTEGEKLIVPSGATVTLTGTAPEGAHVECGTGVNVTLDNVTIYCNTSSICALSFTGTGNTLNLRGVSQLKSGVLEPGIKVEDTTELVINGPGEINAEGYEGAGIGGSMNHDGGTIIINSGTIKAKSSVRGAGIGGGHYGDGGTIIIKGGIVEAEGISNGAGIGGGRNGEGGTIIIEGGTVTASANDTIGEGAAGIGGGAYEDGGTIIIKGGTVEAKGDGEGAGIGAGAFGRSSTIEISGGHIVATGGVGMGSYYSNGSGTIDITGGKIYASSMDGDISTGTLNISGDSAVFLEYDIAYSTTPNTTHVHSEYAQDAQVHSKYRSDIPSGWSYPINSYISSKAPYFTSDEENTYQLILTSDGMASLIAEDENGSVDIDRFEVVGGSLPSGITLNSDGTFSGGATARGEYIATINVVDRNGLTDTTTLQVTVKDILVTPITKTIDLGETFTPNIRVYPPGASVTWSNSNPLVATVDASGQVTGTTIGRAIITAQTTTDSDECLFYVVDSSTPAPAPSDPSKMVTVDVVDDFGSPLSGVYVSLFSDPQTVVTGDDGVAIFWDVPYNTNAPHTLIIESPRGVERGRFTITFKKADVSSASIDDDTVDVKYNKLAQNIKIAIRMTASEVSLLSAEVVNHVPRVANPETGQDFAANISMLGIAIILLLYTSLSIKYIVAKSQNKAR